MFKRIVMYIFLIGLFLSNYAIANENLLTLKQQLDRLQRDVNDLSKSVYNKTFEPSNSSNQKQETINFSAIDIRIYDLEQDIKNLTLSFEELTFQFDDILNSLSSLEQNINFEKRDLLNYNAGYSMGYVNTIHDLVDAVNNMKLKIKMHCKPKYVERITVYKNILKYIESNPNSLNQHPVNFQDAN